LLEDEEKVMGTIAWAKDVSGNFSTPANSKTGVLTVVGSNRTVHFTLRGDYLGVTLTAASANGGAGSLITASTRPKRSASFRPPRRSTGRPPRPWRRVR
jgi:hypothetical protein